VPYLDALPTVASVAGQVLLGRKLVENWAVWLAVNVGQRRPVRLQGAVAHGAAVRASSPCCRWWAGAPGALEQPMAEALVIAIVGAESTGKTTLARRPWPQRLAHRHPQRVHLGARVLRQWCDAQGRTPQAHEQAGIAARPAGAHRPRRRTHDIVVATPRR
jgi:hypothetical protein